MTKIFISKIIMPLVKYISLAFLFILILVVFLQNKDDIKDKIAIIKLDPINLDEKIADTVTETLITTISKNNKYNVVERSQINKIYEELKLSNTEDFEKDDLIEIGKLSQAKLILIGSVSKLENKYIINIRVLDITSGKIIYGDNISCSSEDELYNSAIKIADKISGKMTEETNSSSSQSVKTENNFAVPEYVFTDSFESFNENLWIYKSISNDLTFTTKNGTLQMSEKSNPGRLNSINSITSKEFKVSSFAVEISFRDTLASCNRFDFTVGNTDWIYGNSLSVSINFEKEYYGFYWRTSGKWKDNEDKLVFESLNADKNFHKVKIVYDQNTKIACAYLDDKLIDKVTDFNFNRKDKLQIEAEFEESNYNTGKEVLFELDDFKSSIDFR